MPTNHVTATYDNFLLTLGGPFLFISMPSPWVHVQSMEPIHSFSLYSYALVISASFSRFECDERPGSVCNDFFYFDPRTILMASFYLFCPVSVASIPPVCEVDANYLRFKVSSITSSEIGLEVAVHCYLLSLFRVSDVHLVMYIQSPLLSSLGPSAMHI